MNDGNQSWWDELCQSTTNALCEFEDKQYMGSVEVGEPNTIYVRGMKVLSNVPPGSTVSINLDKGMAEIINVGDDE